MSLHCFEATGNGYEEVGLFYARTCVVNAWRIDDHDRFPANNGLQNTNLAGTRLETLADILSL